MLQCRDSSDPTGYYEAITIYPARIDAYNKLIEYYKKKSIPDYYLGMSDEMASKADGEAQMASEIVEDLYELLGDE